MEFDFMFMLMVKRSSKDIINRIGLIGKINHTTPSPHNKSSLLVDENDLVFEQGNYAHTWTKDNLARRAVQYVKHVLLYHDESIDLMCIYRKNNSSKVEIQTMLKGILPIFAYNVITSVLQLTYIYIPIG